MGLHMRTPLNRSHREHGGKMIDFAGWDMPVQFDGVIEEHMAVRQHVGAFDVSHMGDLIIRGPNALDLLQRLLTNDMSGMAVGKGRYAHILREDGTIIDDTIVFRISDGEYLMIPNAATKDRVLDWVMRNVDGQEVIDVSDRVACIAVQGPEAQKVLGALTPTDLSTVGRFFTADVGFPGLVDSPLLDGVIDTSGCLVSRTGYTGEDGFEVLVSPESATALWERLMGMGVSPIGLGARDTLRLEKGYLLSGTDFDGAQTSLQTGPPWVVKFNHPFIGRDALEAQRDAGDYPVLKGMVVEGRGVPRHGYELVRDGGAIGAVTSGTMSPVLRKGIALGYVPRDVEVGDGLEMMARGRAVPCRVAPLPFV